MVCGRRVFFTTTNGTRALFHAREAEEIVIAAWQAERSHNHTVKPRVFAEFVMKLNCIAGLYFVFWSLTSQQMRFLIAVLPFLATAAASSIAALLTRLRGERRQAVAEAVVTLLIVGLVAQAGGRYIMGGWRAAGTYLQEGSAVRQTVVHPIYGFINEQLPDEARLLMINTNHGFFCHREYLADSFFEASQTRELVEDCESSLEVAELLRSRGLTHVLVDARSRGIPYSEAFQDFLAEPEPLAERIHTSEDGRFTLLELR